MRSGSTSAAARRAAGARGLADLEGVRRTIAQYGQLLDDQRFAEWAELFTEDAEFASVPGTHLPGNAQTASFVGRRAIVAAVSDVQKKLSAQWPVIYFGGNPVIDVQGDSALAWWDFLVMYLKPEGAEIAHAGRYYAQLVRDAGRWRFRRRVSVRPGYVPPPDLTPTSAV